MKQLFENWRKWIKYIKYGHPVIYAADALINKSQRPDTGGTIYYWQTRGPWEAKKPIKFGVTHVPQARPRAQAAGRIEEIFEEVRVAEFPTRPSRLSCIFLCENLEGYEGGSFCVYPAYREGETYEVELRGKYNMFKTNSEFWTEAVFKFPDEELVAHYARAYWEGEDRPWGIGEILVSPPKAAIIMRKYEAPEVPGLEDEDDEYTGGGGEAGGGGGSSSW